MFRRLQCFFVIVLILPYCLCSCSNEKNISFTCKIDQTTCVGGETITVRVLAENVGKPIGVTGPIHNNFGVAKLINGDYEIVCEMLTSSPENTKWTFRKGQSGEKTYYFSIPTDAPAGNYDLVVSLLGVSGTLDNVIVVAG